MHDRLTGCIGRYGFMATLHVTALALGVALAWWRLLPFDLSRMPLAVVTTSQCCVFAWWSATGQASWWTCTLRAVGFLGFVSGLLWFLDGMGIPGELWILATYPLYGAVLMTGVVSLLYVLRSRAAVATSMVAGPGLIRFSILDLMLLTLLCSVVLSLILWIPPDLAKLEYTYDLVDYIRWLTASTLLTLPATVAVIRISCAGEIRLRNLILAIGLTLFAGVLTAWLLGIRANPLWASYALRPALTALLVALALLAQRLCSTLSVVNIKSNPSTPPSSPWTTRAEMLTGLLHVQS